MNVVIVAGGLGTRFGSLSCFPKILLPTINHNSILEEDIETFKGNDLYLIINEKFYDMVINYVNVNNLKSKIKVIAKTSNSNGSYNSILDAYSNYKLPKKDILFVWSDLVIKDDLLDFICNSDSEEKTNIVYTYNNEKYRYKYENGKVLLTDDYSGNIPGIYYVNNYDNLLFWKLNEKDNIDLLDAIAKTNISSWSIENLIEYRDYKTYIDIIKKGQVDYTFKTRFFNSLTVDGDVLSKQAIDPNYYSIIEKEYKWYQFGKNNIEHFEDIVPNTFDYSKNNHSFKMDYLKDYIQLHKYIKTANIDDIKLVYKNIQSALNKIHSFKLVGLPKFMFESDLKKEVVDKVIDRCDKIKYMLINYNEEQRNYMIELLDKAYNYLVNIESDKVDYAFCHSDLNGSNIMVNPNNCQVKFIDPRGYFGNTKVYGWVPYEYAKLLYCLYGYDDFNNLPQIYGVDEPIKLNCVNDIEYLNKKEYRVLVGVIYVALAGYISQDIMKANIAYEYGIKLLKNEL